jgi:lipopolysaccharide transport system ATP-binding protein
MAVIKADNLGKKYVIAHQRKRYLALRDLIAESFAEFGKRLAGRGIADPSKEEVWALRDVSFEIEKGSRVGIIGRNGAGKSTLLKILSRITEPTTGKVGINGRVASLLEVGTGFHPELTGSENIYMNGAILGMSNAEIKRKFDEIVDFAETEKYLDTPVKRYSSGMYLRLAFAVAAHLEPEVLIVDEVLAVGDAAFRKKCLGKMETVSKNEGRTILFVSHSMSAVEQLCESVILLEKGAIKNNSRDVRSIINEYLFDPDNKNKRSEWINSGNEYENPYFKPLRVALCDKLGNMIEMPARNDEDIFVEIEAEIKEKDAALIFGYRIFMENGSLLYRTNFTDTSESDWISLKKGLNVIRGEIPKRILNEGNYKIDINASLYKRQWLCRPGVNSPCVFLTIQGEMSDSPYWAKREGIIAPVIEWELVKRNKLLEQKPTAHE